MAKQHSEETKNRVFSALAAVKAARNATELARRAEQEAQDKYLELLLSLPAGYDPIG